MITALKKYAVYTLSFLIISCASTPEPWDGYAYAVSPSRGGLYLKEKEEVILLENASGYIAFEPDEFHTLVKKMRSECGP